MKVVITVLIFLSISLKAQKPEKYGVNTAYDIPVGLNVGEKAPIIQTITIEGDSINTRKYIGKQEIIVIFYRGDWCPVCSKYLSNLNDSLKYITQKGAKLIAIGPETKANAKNTQSKTKAEFSIVSDTALVYAKAFDVLFKVTDKYQSKIKTFLFTDIAENNGNSEAYLPVPATFIIDKKGVIKFKQFDYNYKNRASVKAMLEHLD